MKKYHAQIDLPNKQLHLVSLALWAPTNCPLSTNKIAVRVKEKIKIQPENIVEVMANIGHLDAGGTWLLEESARHRQPASVAWTFVQVISDQVLVCLFNTWAEAVTVYADTEVATL